jgi:hypothetical protein
VRHLLRNAKAFGLALVVLALSASLAFGAQPTGVGMGRATAAQNAGKTVPVQGADETTEGSDEDTEEVGEDEDTEAEETVEEAPVEEVEDTEEDGGDHCAVDPTALPPEELATMNHGALVCWAAHQTEWPAEFSNHGAWVKSWAQSGKDAAKVQRSDTAKGKGHGKGKNRGASGD